MCVLLAVCCSKNNKQHQQKSHHIVMMETIKLILYELQPCRPQDVVAFYHWTVRNATSLYQHIPINYVAAECFTFLRTIHLKTFALTSIWILLWLCAIYVFQMGNLFLICSMAVAMFTNFDDRKANSMSAYSIFNSGCQRILGTMTAEQFEKERVGNHHYHDEKEDDDDNDETPYNNIGNEEDHDADDNSKHGKQNKKHHTGKKSRRNYEERKRRKDQYQHMIDDQFQQEDHALFMD